MDWLQVSPDELRFRRVALSPIAAKSEQTFYVLDMIDREMLSRYKKLDLNVRKTVREVVMALSLSVSFKKRD